MWTAAKEENGSPTKDIQQKKVKLKKKRNFKKQSFFIVFT